MAAETRFVKACLRRRPGDIVIDRAVLRRHAAQPEKLFYRHEFVALCAELIDGVEGDVHILLRGVVQDDNGAVIGVCDNILHHFRLTCAHVAIAGIDAPENDR